MPRPLPRIARRNGETARDGLGMPALWSLLVSQPCGVHMSRGGPVIWRRILSSYDPETDTVLWYSMAEVDGLYRYVYEARPYAG